MNIESELYKQNPWWEERFKEESISREEYLDKITKILKTKEIIFLTGLRRIGKTTILKQTIAKMLQSKIPKEDILFINLDSFNLLEYSIHKMIEEYRKIHKKGSSDF